MSNIVIFTGGETADANKALHWLKKIQIDFIIAADSGFDNAIKFNQIPNLVIGDFDSKSKEKIQEYIQKNQKSFENCEIQSWPTDKDFTDTELALMEGKNRFQTANELFMILVGGDGGRLDHLFGIQHIFSTENFPNIWIGKEQVILCLDSERNFNKIKISNILENDVVSVFPIFPKKYEKSKYQIESKNLKWDLQAVNWLENEISLSNRLEEATEKTCELFAINGRFLVFLPLHSEVNINTYKTKL